MEILLIGVKHDGSKVIIPANSTNEQIAKRKEFARAGKDETFREVRFGFFERTKPDVKLAGKISKKAEKTEPQKQSPVKTPKNEIKP